MGEPRWLVDEMLGRLARYLRFLGYDAEYVRGATDDEVAARARAEGRRVLTRDRALAQRLPDGVRLTRTDIAGQLQELHRAFPELRREVSFNRCSLCNGQLVAGGRPPTDAQGADRRPAEVREGRVPFYTCAQCGHLYWEGSHTRSVRRRLAEWFPERVAR